VLRRWRFVYAFLLVWVFWAPTGSSAQFMCHRECPEEDLAQYWERLDCCGRDGWIILHYPIASPLEAPFSCTFAEPFYPIVGCGQFTGGSCSW
jgi:hypothetical protein